MRRAILAILLLLVSLVPLAQAAPNPQMGYVPGPHSATVQPGATVTYSFSLLLTPADGDNSVVLEAWYGQAPGAIAPPTAIAVTGPGGEQFSIPAFSSYQDPKSTLVALADWGTQSKSFSVQVTATLPVDQPPGDFTSRLNMVARDPDTRSSSPGIIYLFDYAIPNVAPTASFVFTANFLQVSFDASASSDADGHALTYAWDFGDGSSSTLQKPTKTFAAAGSYAVRLTVTDQYGASGTSLQTVTVTQNLPPIAAFTYTVSGLTVSFDGTSSSDPEGGALAFAWNFGDGSSASSQTTTRTYATTGTKVVTLTVTDPSGRTDSEIKSIDLAADNHPPTAGFTFTTNGLQATFTSQAADPDGDALTYGWEFGDDQTSNQANPVHGYGAGGSFTVRLTVTDTHGAQDTESKVVTVAVVSSGDSDGDGTTDTQEEDAGSDPGAPASNPNDRDGDGIANEKDNCPNAPNRNQADKDKDSIGDACDLAEDGPNGDPDRDGKPSSQDNCPAAANADQADLDGDGRGDACDPDLDGDGVVNEADAFPRDPRESSDTDGDGIGDGKETDADNDGIQDADELAAGTDPLDRQDPPFAATRIVSLRLDNGTVLVAWEAAADTRAVRYLVWREASPLVLLTSLEPREGNSFRFYDPDAPRHARYHVQAQLAGDGTLLYALGDARVSNWVDAYGGTDEGCEGQPDSDGDGLCDPLEVQLGLDANDPDSDGDGVSDGDEVLGRRASVPFLADSDGDGLPDGRDSTPLELAARRSRLNGSTIAIVLLSVAVITLAGLQVVKSGVLVRKPKQPPT